MKILEHQNTLTIMKKIGKILAVAAIAMVSYSASAELAPQWSKGTMVGNIHFDFDPFFVDDLVGTDISLDYVLVDEWWMGHFTVGGEIDFAGHDNVKNIGLTPRATYGLNISDSFEVHAVAGLGSVHHSVKWDDVDGHRHHDKDWRLYETFLLGCRYFFADNLAATAEYGWTAYMPELRIGLSLKF